jgi:Rod binding domain-containing protein
MAAGLNALSSADQALFRATSAPSSASAPAPAGAQSLQARARAKAEDFEAVFLNTMFQQMYTGLEGDGPFGGGTGVGVWRSFLTDQYAKSMVKAGGIGLADHVYRSLLGQQEVAAK